MNSVIFNMNQELNYSVTFGCLMSCLRLRPLRLCAFWFVVTCLLSDVIVMLHNEFRIDQICS